MSSLTAWITIIPPYVVSPPYLAPSAPTLHCSYEWNKYNQTHYDSDNPPPKVVQGYKFNIMYFDLIDKSKVRTGVSWQRKRACAGRLGQRYPSHGYPVQERSSTLRARRLAPDPWTQLRFEFPTASINLSLPLPCPGHGLAPSRRPLLLFGTS